MSKLGLTPWFARRSVVHRSRQIARVLTGHGLGTLVDQAGLARFAPLLRRRPPPVPLTQAQRLGIAFGELGTTFIKLGQILSTRADLLPVDVVTELAKLQDHAPPVPFEDVRETIARELGQPADLVFASLDPEPIASASIGQVHAATLRNGASVVVKVQRPGVADTVERDLDILAGIAGWIETHTVVGRDYEVTPIIEEFAYTIRNELDYRREGQNCDRLRRFFAGDAGIHVPYVYWDHTTARVLTLERMGGIKISDLAAIDRAGIPRRAIAENAVRIFLRQLLELGFFHADPHPGNFFVQPDASLAMVDFGMVGRLNETVQAHLLRAGLAAIQQDAETLAEELYALGVAGRHARRRAFQRDLDHIIGHYGGLSLRELSAAEVTGALTAIVYRHRLQLPSELALLLRVACMSEGVGLSLDPGFHYLEYASPLFRKRWEQRQSLRSTVERLGRAAADAAELTVELPRRAGRLLGRIERGEMELNVRHEGIDAFANQFQRMTNRLALSVILAASVVALGLALGVHRLPQLERYLDWLFTLAFVFSLGFGAWLIVSIWRAGRK
jgi:ubiquinone biosynthesis protein